MDRPELFERYPTAEDVAPHREPVRDVIEDWTGDRTTDEIVGVLSEDIPCSPVQTAAGTFKSDHVRARNMLPEVSHAFTGEKGVVAGTPIKFQDASVAPHRRAPLLGEHTAAVLCEETDLDPRVVARILQRVTDEDTGDPSENGATDSAGKYGESVGRDDGGRRRRVWVRGRR